LIPTDQCQDVIFCKPRHCRRCGRKLTGCDAAPLRHQVWDLPEIQPLVTEYQRHRLLCSCGTTTCGDLPPGVPPGQAGPRLIALVALLMGCFRQSKRRVALFLEQVLNQPCSPGWVVKLQNQATAALRPCYEQLAAQLPDQEQLGIDETPTKQGPDKAWLWTAVAATFTVFALRTTRAAPVLGELLGAAYGGVVNCDRAKMYYSQSRLQWCWAHLKRDFQALIDSGDGVKKRLGHDLMRPTRKLFRLWARYRDGTLTRVGFQRLMKPIRREIDALLLRGAFAGIGMAEELSNHRDWLWTFVDVDGVEPTNNASERALRHAVIWRKLSFGTQSDSGSRFVETLLTVVETCRQQSQNVFAFITTAVEAHSTHHRAPSLAEV
jgi:transposase